MSYVHIFLLAKNLHSGHFFLGSSCMEESIVRIMLHLDFSPVDAREHGHI